MQLISIILFYNGFVNYAFNFYLAVYPSQRNFLHLMLSRHYFGSFFNFFRQKKKKKPQQQWIKNICKTQTSKKRLSCHLLYLSLLSICYPPLIWNKKIAVELNEMNTFNLQINWKMLICYETLKEIQTRLTGIPNCSLSITTNTTQNMK